MVPSVFNVTETAVTPTSISLKWVQPDGAAAVYTILPMRASGIAALTFPSTSTVLAELTQLQTMLTNAQTLLNQIVVNAKNL